VLLAVLLITPSLLEEIVFRGLLLPHPREGASRRQTLSYAAVSLGIFLVWHPLNGWLFRPEALSLFSDPIFLSLAALLGGATMTAYLRSASLWPAILLHWLTVVTWIVFFGGSRALGA
jgi:predicted Abi (CAAX) family protease